MTMDHIYMIGDLSRITGLSIDTINYYLRIDLIREISRSQGNKYRYFNDATVEKLRKIRELRAQNVPIREIKRLFGEEI